MNFKEALKREADRFNENIAEGVINLIDGQMARAAEEGKYYINYPLTYIAEESEIVKHYAEQEFSVDTIISDDYGLALFISWA